MDKRTGISRVFYAYVALNPGGANAYGARVNVWAPHAYRTVAQAERHGTAQHNHASRATRPIASRSHKQSGATHHITATQSERHDTTQHDRTRRAARHSIAHPHKQSGTTWQVGKASEVLLR